METAIGTGRAEHRIEALHARYAPDMFHLAYLLTGNREDAEELTQEAFTRLLARFGDLRKPEAVRSYLLRSVSNLAKNEYRRRAMDDRHRQPIQEIDRPGSATLEDRDQLVRALRRLPYRQQVALVLRYCVDLSEFQTAEVMGTSTKAVKSLTSRALKALRDQVEVDR